MTLRHLVISGGGSRGAWAVGLVRALTAEGRSWACASGVSVGALVASRVAQYPESHAREAAADLVADFASTADGTVFASWPGGTVQALAEGSLYSTGPLAHTIRQRLSERRLVLPCWSYSVDLTTATLTPARLDALAGPAAVRALLASCAFPGAMPPVRFDGDAYHYDGGVIRTVPLLDALEQHARSEVIADEIDVILCTPPDALPDVTDPATLTGPLGALARVQRTIELATYQRCADDVRRALLRWQLIPGAPVVRLYWPDVTPTEDPMRFRPDEIDRAMAAGRAARVRWTWTPGQNVEVPSWL